VTSRYVIGGVGFTTTEPLPDLAATGYADLDVDVIFSDRLPDRNTLPGPQGTCGSFDLDGNALVLVDQGDVTANAWLLRQMAPIVSSVAHRLVLHASAVQAPRGVIAFVGGSGAGKSTLAQAFPNPVADDLVPVRFTEVALTPAVDRLEPLAGVYFLERRGDELNTEQLPASAALDMQIINGFGEHSDPDTWAFQFDTYHRLAAAVRHYILTIPDGLSALPQVVEHIAQGLEDGDIS